MRKNSGKLPMKQWDAIANNRLISIDRSFSWCSKKFGVCVSLSFEIANAHLRRISWQWQPSSALVTSWQTLIIIHNSNQKNFHFSFDVRIVFLFCICFHSTLAKIANCCSNNRSSAIVSAFIVKPIRVLLSLL